MSAAIKVRAAVIKWNYSRDSRGRVELFLDRDLCLPAGASDNDGELMLEQKCDVTLRVPLELPEDATIHVWLYCRSFASSASVGRHAPVPDGSSPFDVNGQSLDAKKQPQEFERMLGSGKVGIIDLMPSYQDVAIYDVNQTQVATMRLCLIEVPDRTVVIGPPSVDAARIDAEETIQQELATQEAFFTRHKDFKATNVDAALRTTNFLVVRLPCGHLPIWAFPRCATLGRHTSKERNDAMVALLENHAAIALTTMRLTADAVLHGPDELRAEFIAEMQCLVTRYMLYQRDASRSETGIDVPVDDWEICRDLSLTGDDCESMSAVILEMAHVLRLTTGGSPFLQTLRLFDLQCYMDFFALVTISTSSAIGFTYHACVIKLDRYWVNERLDEAAGRASIRARAPSGYVYKPMVVLESTSYTTSCTAYKDRAVTSDSYRTGTNANMSYDALVKAPVSMTFGVYRHAQVLISPELLQSHKLSRIDLTYKGSRAAPLSALRDFSSAVTFHPSYTTSGVIEAVDIALRGMPHLSIIRQPDSKTPAWEIVAQARVERGRSIETSHERLFAGAYAPFIDIGFRGVDYRARPSLAAEFNKVAAAVVPDGGAVFTEVLMLNITSRIKAVRMRAWKL